MATNQEEASSAGPAENDRCVTYTSGGIVFFCLSVYESGWLESEYDPDFARQVFALVDAPSFQASLKEVKVPYHCTALSINDQPVQAEGSYELLRLLEDRLFLRDAQQ